MRKLKVILAPNMQWNWNSMRNKHGKKSNHGGDFDNLSTHLSYYNQAGDLNRGNY